MTGSDELRVIEHDAGWVMVAGHRSYLVSIRRGAGQDAALYEVIVRIPPTRTIIRVSTHVTFTAALARGNEIVDRQMPMIEEMLRTYQEDADA